jgi:hypothetical protein
VHCIRGCENLLVGLRELLSLDHDAIEDGFKEDAFVREDLRNSALKQINGLGEVGDSEIFGQSGVLAL